MQHDYKYLYRDRNAPTVPPANTRRYGLVKDCLGILVSAAIGGTLLAYCLLEGKF